MKSGRISRREGKTTIGLFGNIRNQKERQRLDTNKHGLRGILIGGRKKQKDE